METSVINSVVDMNSKNNNVRKLVNKLHNSKMTLEEIKEIIKPDDDITQTGDFCNWNLLMHAATYSKELTEYLLKLNKFDV